MISCWIWVVPSRIWKVFASRNMRSTGTSRVRPAPPSTCTASVVARMAAPQHAFFAMRALVEARRPTPAATSRIASSHRARAAATSVTTSASRNPRPWWRMIGCPNASRVRAWSSAISSAPRAVPSAHRGDVQPRLVQRHHRQPEALAVRAEQLARRVVEPQLGGRDAAQAEQVLVPHDGQSPRRAARRGTPRCPPPVRAQTREHVAHRAVRDVELRAGDAEPVAVRPGGRLRAPPASEPAPGSVRQKHGTSEPSATPGSTRARCASRAAVDERADAVAAVAEQQRAGRAVARDPLDHQHRGLEADLDAAVLGRDTAASSPSSRERLRRRRAGTRRSRRSPRRAARRRRGRARRRSPGSAPRRRSRGSTAKTWSATATVSSRWFVTVMSACPGGRRTTTTRYVDPQAVADQHRPGVAEPVEAERTARPRRGSRWRRRPRPSCTAITSEPGAIRAP